MYDPKTSYMVLTTYLVKAIITGVEKRWEVEHTNEFSEWFAGLSVAEQEDIAQKVAILERIGPSLNRPHADTLKGSQFPNMKELRVKRNQIRVFFAFDSRRMAILLIGGSKIGDGGFYERMIPIADQLYEEHLAEIAQEGDNG